MTTVKECPKCGAALAERTNRNTKHQFLGCTRWPDCDHTENMTEEYRMLKAGAQMLPGMEITNQETNT